MFLLLATMVVFSIPGGAKWINGYFHHETHVPFVAKLKFALGQTSFRDALLASYQPRNPAIWPRREVSEVCLNIRDAMRKESRLSGSADARLRVWTMTFLQEAGCHILPDVRIMMEISNRFGTRWHRIVFGSAALAEHEPIRSASLTFRGPWRFRCNAKDW